MKWSETFIPTMKEAPKEAEIASHKLMLRSGLIQNLSSGLYTYLPLGKKVLDKVMTIIRDELNKAGAIELTMPVLQPKAIWEKTGRWDLMADLMLRVTDREEKEFVLGPTHEEIITDIVAKRINSYRQLPINLYQIQSKFRDEIRPRFGVIRAKEFIMKDGYSFDLGKDEALESYQKMYDAYSRIFTRMGIDVSPVEADTGAMGDGGRSHEFMALTEIGEDTIAKCPECGYAANIELAVRDIKLKEKNSSELFELEKVETRDIKSVEEVTGFFNVPAAELIKTILFKTDEDLVVVLIRGDLEVNQVKLKKLLKVSHIELADDEDVLKVTNAPCGFAGPVGITNTRMIVDISLRDCTNMITGANEKDFHLKNVNPGRDFQIDDYFDIGTCEEGDFCVKCCKPYIFKRGIEVGQVFFLGKKYSEPLGAKVLDKNGKDLVLTMGCYGIGVSRTVAAVIECNHDDCGITWPVSIAPFEVVVTPADKQGSDSFVQAKDIYESLLAKGIDVIFDDRNERPGFKFKDAELIGFPVRVTVGRKSLENGGAEVFIRHSMQKDIIPIDQTVENVIMILESLKSDLSEKASNG